MTEALAATRAGHVLWVSGEIGQGKTTLLRRLEAVLGAAGEACVYVPVPTLDPESLAIWILSMLGRPTDSGVDGLARAASEGLTLLVDDAELLPEESAALLASLAAEAPAARPLRVVCSGTGPAPEALAPDALERLEDDAEATLRRCLDAVGLAGVEAAPLRPDAPAPARDRAAALAPPAVRLELEVDPEPDTSGRTPAAAGVAVPRGDAHLRPSGASARPAVAAGALVLALLLAGGALLVSRAYTPHAPTTAPLPVAPRPSPTSDVAGTATVPPVPAAPDTVGAESAPVAAEFPRPVEAVTTPSAPAPAEVVTTPPAPAPAEVVTTPPAPAPAEVVTSPGQAVPEEAVPAPPEAPAADVAAAAPRTDEGGAPAAAGAQSLEAPGATRVIINAVPAALVSLNGEIVGGTPIADLEVPAGLHHFKAVFQDGQVVEREVEVVGGVLLLVFP